MKTFFNSYKKALDGFSTSFNKAVTQYEKDFIFKGKSQSDQVAVDSLSTAMANVKMCFDEMNKGLSEQAETVQRELIDPIEIAHKQY